MSSRRLLNRIPAERISVACLHHHELRFHKCGSDGSAKADAYETGRVHHAVHGVVFEIDERHKRVLDAHEGLHNGYEIKHVNLETNRGDMTAYMYYATHIDSTLKPLHWYKEHVLRGALENDLPEPYIERIERVVSVADAEIERHHRELSIYC